jgi:putative SOS response-associated peptidase YedK
MCGRFVSASDSDGLVRFFVIDERKTDDLPPSYNVAPTDPVYAVAAHDDRRYLVSFRWGLVPHWAESPATAAKMMNARAETAADKPAYREALRRRRCLIPADGFYEWRRDPAGTKTPHFIHRPDEQPIAFAGLWETWRDKTDPQAPPLKTCTILTRPAVLDLQVLHDRMPVTLPPDTWDAWLDNGTPLPAVQDLLRTTPPPLTFRAVSQQVNSVRNNGP